MDSATDADQAGRPAANWAKRPAARTLAPGGTLNRVIRLVAGLGGVRAVVEDDFHHFRLELLHERRIVKAIRTESPRAPYSLCPAAGLQLRGLIGSALSTDPTLAGRIVDAREQCTHQFDLAGLAIAAAARGPHERRYDICVTDPVDGRQHASLARDGVQVLAWEIERYAITAPAPFVGHSLGSGFTAWVAETLDDQAAEDALVLRRGVFISGGRGLAEWLDALEHANTTGGCWVQQPERAPDARRNRGSTQDFTGRAEMLTSDDDAWLADARFPQCL